MELPPHLEKRMNKRQVQMHTIEKRLEVLRWMRQNQQSVSDAARNYGLCPSTIRNWVRNEKELLAQTNTHFDRKRVKPLRDVGKKSHKESVSTDNSFEQLECPLEQDTMKQLEALLNRMMTIM